jgi:hypothetical protein
MSGPHFELFDDRTQMQAWDEFHYLDLAQTLGLSREIAS